MTSITLTRTQYQRLMHLLTVAESVEVPPSAEALMRVATERTPSPKAQRAAGKVTSKRTSKRAAKPGSATFATKAERAAGGGFSCECGRTGLRTPALSGAFHRAPNGSVHTVA